MSRRLARALSDEKECVRQYGAAQAAKVRLRVAALQAADSLADFWPPNSGPERCHELQGDLKGVFSMDLKQPHRLLFRPVGWDESVEYEEPRERWKAIKSIEITEIKDTHG